MENLSSINIDEALDATLNSGDMFKECGIPMDSQSPMTISDLIQSLSSPSRITVTDPTMALPLSDIISKSERTLTPMSINGNGFDDATVDELSGKIKEVSNGDKNRMKIMIMKIKSKLDLLDNPRNM